MNRVDFQGRGRGSGRGRERRNPPLSPLITLVKFHLRSREPGRGFLFLSFLFLKTSIPRIGFSRVSSPRKLLEIDAVHESLREPSFENKSNSLQLSNAGEWCSSARIRGRAIKEEEEKA